MALAALKTQLQTWDAAMESCNQEDYEKALQLFDQISDSSKICFNMGLIQLHSGHLEECLPRLTSSITMDPMLAIAYFERGICYFELGKLQESLSDFRDAVQRMGGDRELDYKEQGLKYTLYLAEILFNEGLVLLALGRQSDGQSCLGRAILKKSTAAHNRMHDALAYPDKKHELFKVPVTALFRPTESKLKFLEEYDESVSCEKGGYTTADKLLPILPARGSVVSFVTTANSLYTDGSATYLPSFQSAPLPTRPNAKRRHTVDFPVTSSAPSRAELAEQLGKDCITPITEISTIPCAGTRIASGSLEGLMAFRFVVQLASSSSKHAKESSHSLMSHHKWTSPAVVTNFILDTGISTSPIPPEALRDLKYQGSFNPGTPVMLTIQGVRTKCVVGHEGEAGRLGGNFLTDGSLTFHFDSRLDAPVLYVADEFSPHAFIPRTVQPSIKRMSLRDAIGSLLNFRPRSIRLEGLPTTRENKRRSVAKF